MILALPKNSDFSTSWHQHLPALSRYGYKQMHPDDSMIGVNIWSELARKWHKMFQPYDDTNF
jgi:hypothetical protein